MKKIAIAGMCITVLLAGCGDPMEIKLSEMNLPENAKKLKVSLSEQDQQMLKGYVIGHMISGDINYEMTVKDAIAASKASKEKINALHEAEHRARMDAIKAMDREFDKMLGK